MTSSDRAVRLCCGARGVDLTLTAALAVGLARGGRSGGVSFASDRRGGYVFPDFLPAFDAAAALARLVVPPGPSRRVRWPRWSRPCRPCRSCRGGGDTVGAEGPGHADADGAAGRGGGRAGAGRRHQGRLATRAGPSSCPTPRTRSPTSGPKGADLARRPRRWSTAYARADRAGRRPEVRKPAGRLPVVRYASPPMNIPDDLRYSPDTSGSASKGRTGARRASPTTPRTRWGTSSSSTCRRSGARSRRAGSWARWSRRSRCRRSTRRSPARSRR